MEPTFLDLNDQSSVTLSGVIEAREEQLFRFGRRNLEGQP
jgi:hypothetical protein